MDSKSDKTKSKVAETTEKVAQTTKKVAQTTGQGAESTAESTGASSSTSDRGTALYYELVAESLGQHKAIPNSPGDIFFAVQEGAAIPR